MAKKNTAYPLRGPSLGYSPLPQYFFYCCVSSFFCTVFLLSYILVHPCCSLMLLSLSRASHFFSFFCSCSACFCITCVCGYPPCPRSIGPPSQERILHIPTHIHTHTHISFFLCSVSTNCSSSTLAFD
jgi:hypothetical protein